MEQSNLKTADNLPARSPGKTRNLISRVVRWSWWLPALYLLALACAETLTSWVNPWTGQALHGLILVLALTSASHSGGGRQQRFLQALALPSLIRLLSLSLQLNHYPLILRHLAVGIPLFLATFLFMRASRLKWNMIGITRRGWSWQVLVGVSGIGLGFLEYIILRPDPPVAEHHWSIILALAFTLLLGQIRPWPSIIGA